MHRKSAAKRPVSRAVGRKTMILCGSHSSRSRTAAVVPNMSSSWQTRNACSTCVFEASVVPMQSTTSCRGRSANFVRACSCAGKVAEKSSVWRSSRGGSLPRIRSIAGRKPMSRSWSASSKTSARRLPSKGCSPLFVRWSSRRPGVATRTRGACCLKDLVSAFMFVPPSMVIVRCSGMKRSKALDSSAVCIASSRVGERQRTLIGPLERSESVAWSAGSKKARVLPVPVFAFAITSTPVRQVGIASCWTLVMHWYSKTSLSERCSAGWSERLVKGRSVSAALVVEVVRAACTTGGSVRAGASVHAPLCAACDLGGSVRAGASFHAPFRAACDRGGSARPAASGRHASACAACARGGFARPGASGRHASACAACARCGFARPGASGRHASARAV
mmetsp:Transcript_10903/g.31954  ORF Transcript_10903/g.31954 Transcript_10903/m.31954 type:complete len:393 (+) Transcript_10903:775-1953(+)